MVTIFKYITGGGQVQEVRCLSTDDKPTDVLNGSTCIEIDTGKLYMFDKESSEWKEL